MRITHRGAVHDIDTNNLTLCNLDGTHAYFREHDESAYIMLEACQARGRRRGVGCVVSHTIVRRGGS